MGFALNTNITAKACATSAVEPKQETIATLLDDIERALVETYMTDMSSISALDGGENCKEPQPDGPQGILHRLHVLRDMAHENMNVSRQIRKLID